ncbi:hypothetical protein CCP4SC76_4310004 [Gammaproteobacteria bacterium]
MNGTRGVFYLAATASRFFLSMNESERQRLARLWGLAFLWLEEHLPIISRLSSGIAIKTGIEFARADTL